MASGRRGPIIKKGDFRCDRCNISTPYHSFGRRHPFTETFVLLEEAYLARDPFNPSPRPLVVGSHCSNCKKQVCVSSSCSIFYCRRFCIDCVLAHPKEFPPQVLQEINKQQD